MKRSSIYWQRYRWVKSNVANHLSVIYSTSGESVECDKNESRKDERWAEQA